MVHALANLDKKQCMANGRNLYGDIYYSRCKLIFVSKSKRVVESKFSAAVSIEQDITAGQDIVLVIANLDRDVIQLIVSIRKRKTMRDLTGDPWDGRTLEWATSSPSPVYNFAVIPEVHDLDAFADMKEKGIAYSKPERYQDIHMPKNTSSGVINGIFSFLFGFAMVWHIWWLAILSTLGILINVILRSADENTEYSINYTVRGST